MKIAIFIHSMQGGGAERVSCYLANAWVERGYDVTVITLTGTTGDAYQLHPSVHRIGMNLAVESSGFFGALRANVHRVIALRQLLKQLDIDMLIAMMMTASILAVLASSGLKCATVISERCYPPAIPVSRLWFLLRRLVYPRASCVVAQTQDASRWLRESAACKKITVIPNPVVLPLIVRGAVVLPDSILKPERCVLLAAGRLSIEKGFDLLLEAFARIADSHPQWDMVIIGNGVLRDDLILQRDSLLLGSRVMLPGYVGNMADWYKRADLFALSSRSEGFPNVLVEAMAYGCAVVSYDCHAGPRDIIEHGVNGLLVTPPADVDAMALSLSSLMGDNETRISMRGKAVSVQEKFSMPDIISMWEAIINTELKSCNL